MDKKTLDSPDGFDNLAEIMKTNSDAGKVISKKKIKIKQNHSDLKAMK